MTTSGYIPAGANTNAMGIGILCNLVVISDCVSISSSRDLPMIQATLMMTSPSSQPS